MASPARVARRSSWDQPIADAPARRVELKLLGSFELSINGQRVEVPRASQRVLAFLGLNAGPLRRAYVAETLWPETSDERSYASLRSALWRLRSREALVVDTQHAGIRLGEGVRVDVIERRRLADVMAVGPHPPDAAAPEMFGSDLLPDWPDDWLSGSREIWHQFRLHTLEELAREFVRVGLFGRALEAALAALRADPLRESAHRCVIAIHIAEGNYSEALRQYGTCSRVLSEDLGVSPSHLTEELVKCAKPRPSS